MSFLHFEISLIKPLTKSVKLDGAQVLGRLLGTPIMYNRQLLLAKIKVSLLIVDMCQFQQLAAHPVLYGHSQDEDSVQSSVTCQDQDNFGGLSYRIVFKNAFLSYYIPVRSSGSRRLHNLRRTSSSSFERLQWDLKFRSLLNS